MDLLLHLFYQGCLWGQSPAGGSSPPHSSRLMESPGTHTGGISWLSPLLWHNQATEWLSPVLWSGNRAHSAPPGELWGSSSSLAVEALLHRAAPHSLSLSPEWAVLATGDLLLRGLF